MSAGFEIGTMWNGMMLRVVKPGTVVHDPSGKRPPFEVDENHAVSAGRVLYCTAKTEARIIARIEEMQQKRGRRA